MNAEPCGGCRQPVSIDEARWMFRPEQVANPGTPDWRPLDGETETAWHTDCAEHSGIQLHEA